MLALLLRIWSQPATKQILKLLLSAVLGGLAGAEVRQPTFSASLVQRFFGQATEPPNPVQAIGRISMGNTGCTATIIGPIEKRDKQIRILTAAHCLKVGVTGIMQLKDGRKFRFKCVSRDAESDCAWLIADRPEGKIPYALMAHAPPSAGSVIWHQGYGVDRPGNREEGTYLSLASNGNQLRYRLSVSPGDSGGGIVCNATGEVLSPVCCTTRLAGTGDVFGAHPAKCWLMKPDAAPSAVSFEPEDDSPRVNPIITLPHPGWPSPPEQ